MRHHRAVLLAAAVWLGWAAPARAGHELPFYPSYYPQEITIEAMSPAAAAAGFGKSTLHAWLGPDPYAGRPLPKNVGVVESLGSYVVVTFRPGALASREARCAAARRLVGSFTPGPGWTIHPWPVTPYHGDYLHHFDLIEAAKRDYKPRAPGAAPPGLKVRARGALAEALAGAHQRDDKGWGAVVEEVAVADLIASAGLAVNGGLAPPWIKQGWFHAWLLQSAAVSDTGGKRELQELYRRLTAGGGEQLEERLNLERALVRGLGSGCERVVAGYTLRREYLNADYSAGVENVGRDAHTGLTSAIFVRTVKLKDFPWNGWLTVGVGTRPAAAWNPIGGFTDAAGRLVWHAVGDPGLFPEPHNASWTPNRIRLQPGAAGPVPVPRDALLPESGTGLLKEVGEGKTARARLTYRVLTSAFHDGTRMMPADAFYALAFAWKWGGGKGSEHDPHVERATALARDWLIGVKLLRVETDTLRFGDVRMTYQVPVVDAYLARSVPDREQLASVAPPWTTVPWHALALMEEAVTRGVAAFSAEAARRRGLPWLDLVRDGKVKERLRGLLDELESRSHVPPALKGLVTSGEARRRWAALRQFAAEHGHFLVTNGPYLVHAGSGTGAVLRVFRDFSYSMGVGSYDPWAIPLRAYVKRAEVRGDRVEVSAEVEWVERFAREYRIVAEPLGSPAVHKDKGPLPVARWVVVGADGSVLSVGTTEPTNSGMFQLDLGGLPKTGPRTLLIALAVRGNLVNLDVKAVRLE